MPTPPPASAPDPIPTPPPAPTPKPAKRKPGRPKEPKKPGCTVPGCNEPARARGLCWAHYQRQRRHGSPGRAEIGPTGGDLVRVEVYLPLKSWERLAGQGRPFSAIAREALMRAAARLPPPAAPPVRALRSNDTVTSADRELEAFFGAVTELKP